MSNPNRTPSAGEPLCPICESYFRDRSRTCSAGLGFCVCPRCIGICDCQAHVNAVSAAPGMERPPRLAPALTPLPQAWDLSSPRGADELPDSKDASILGECVSIIRQFETAVRQAALEPGNQQLQARYDQKLDLLTAKIWQLIKERRSFRMGLEKALLRLTGNKSSR